MSPDLRSGAPDGFLAADDVVDLDHPAVRALHGRLAAGDPDDVTYARRAFEHVRDRVAHGLVALWVDGRRHRVDPRGVDPRGAGLPFDLVQERLVYVPDPGRGERDVPDVFASPVEEVLAPLRVVPDVRLARLAGDVLPGTR